MIFRVYVNLPEGTCSWNAKVKHVHCCVAETHHFISWAHATCHNNIAGDTENEHDTYTAVRSQGPAASCTQTWMYPRPYVTHIYKLQARSVNNYIYIYVYMIYAYIYIHTCIIIYICIHTHIYIHIHTCIIIYIYVYTYTYNCTFDPPGFHRQTATPANHNSPVASSFQLPPLPPPPLLPPPLPP